MDARVILVQFVRQPLGFLLLKQNLAGTDVPVDVALPMDRVCFHVTALEGPQGCCRYPQSQNAQPGPPGTRAARHPCRSSRTNRRKPCPSRDLAQSGAGMEIVRGFYRARPRQALQQTLTQVKTCLADPVQYVSSKWQFAVGWISPLTDDGAGYYECAEDKLLEHG